MHGVLQMNSKLSSPTAKAKSSGLFTGDHEEYQV